MIFIRPAILLLTLFFTPLLVLPQGLVIGNNANFIVSSGIKMTLNNANCLVQSDDIGTGALVDKNANGNIDISGTATIERYTLRGNSTTYLTGLWHYFSSPVTNQAIDAVYMTANDVSTAAGYYDFFLWEEPTSTWRQYAGPNFTDTEFVPGRGYAIIFDSDGARTFEGTSGTKINTGNINISVYKTTGIAKEAYNLLGNPYPSPISNSDFLTANSAVIEGTMYFWSQKSDWLFDSDNYSYWNGAGSVGNGVQVPDDYTAVGQAFMVQALADNQTVTFTNAMRNPGSPVFLKNEALIARLWLNVTDKRQNYNETLIAFPEDASNGFDNAYDAHKLLNTGVLLLYSRLVDDDGTEYAIQGLPELNGEVVTVPLGMHAQINGQHKISLSDMEHFEPDVIVVLEDKLTGKFTDLLEKQVYTFGVAQSGYLSDRFLLHFNAPMSDEEANEDCHIVIYSYENAIYVKNDTGIQLDGEIAVYNMLGQLIYKKDILQSTMGRYNAPDR
ncbi:MAG: hypothetical protein U9R60_06230, partial [Bacteroidota bacterium]|nr:hypothetical protein [Bacteroidota bacterium]